jgi:hypothetical protein
VEPAQVGGERLNVLAPIRYPDGGV